VIRPLGRRGRNAGRREKDNGESGTEKEKEEVSFLFRPRLLLCAAQRIPSVPLRLSLSLSSNHGQIQVLSPMIMTLRLLDPVPADAGGSGAERSVVAAAGITAERWRLRGATTDVGDEIEARALVPVKDDFDDATAAGRIIIEARALLLLQLEAIAAALEPAFFSSFRKMVKVERELDWSIFLMPSTKRFFLPRPSAPLCRSNYDDGSDKASARYAPARKAVAIASSSGGDWAREREKRSKKKEREC